MSGPPLSSWVACVLDFSLLQFLPLIYVFLFWHSSNTVYPMIKWATERPPVQPVLVRKCSLYRRTHGWHMRKVKTKEQIYRSVLPYSTHVCARTPTHVYLRWSRKWLFTVRHLHRTDVLRGTGCQPSWVITWHSNSQRSGKMERHLQKGQKN